MKIVIALGKIACVAIWMWGLLSFVLESSVPAPDIGRMVFLGFLAVHVAEAFAFAKNLAAEKGGSVGGHVRKLLAFGYFHILDVRYG